MSQFYRLEPPNPEVQYWGNSDLLAQIAYEIRNYPDRCFSKNVLAWYDSAYALSSDDVTDCSYQIEINTSLCPKEPPPSTLEEVIEILIDYSQGRNRRTAIAVLRIIFRETQRRIIEETALST